MSGVRCTCGAGCPTYGACMRRKNISVGQVDRDEQRAWDREIAAYRSARRQGVQPATTKMPDIRKAMEASEKVGKPFDAATGSFG